MHVSSLAEMLRERVQASATRRAYIFLERGEREGDTLSWSDVDLRARAIAQWLVSAGASRSRVVLLYEPGPEFVCACFGCVYAGCIIVPAYPIDPFRSRRTIARLSSIVADVEPSIILTDVASRIALAGAGFSTTTVKVTSEIGSDIVGESCVHTATSDDIAVIQYTSGSLAEPNGVVLTHGNILANECTLQRTHGHNEKTTLVTWVPLAHDWGLINGVLQPAYSGACSVIMSARSFLESPVRWLRAISRYSEVSSGGPTFAYDICTSKVPVEACVGLDLTSWKGACVSAGPVKASTLEAFLDRFTVYGFRREAFYAGYGLAEATLLVSDSPRGHFPRILTLKRDVIEKCGRAEESKGFPEPVTRLVGCGYPSSTKLVIVDPETLQPCPEGRVGEVWLSGDNMSRRYWSPTRESTRFNALLPGTGEGPFFRTGDLGFISYGELFIAGRLSDLIIVHGRNIFPYDIEATVEGCHQACRIGCAAAFSIDVDGEERLIVVQEIRDDSVEYCDEAIGAIRRAISAVYDIAPLSVALLSQGGVPKTSSGKVRRPACRQAYCAGALPVVREHRLVGSIAHLYDPVSIPRAALSADKTDQPVT